MNLLLAVQQCASPLPMNWQSYQLPGDYGNVQSLIRLMTGS
jgi:hypothetical protein